jgi:hypothetical protein
VVRTRIQSLGSKSPFHDWNYVFRCLIRLLPNHERCRTRAGRREVDYMDTVGSTNELHFSRRNGFWYVHSELAHVYPRTDCLPSGCVSIFVTASAPTRKSLGSINGLSQTAVSITRAIGPASVTSLFALSVERNLAMGTLVYLILIAVTVMALLVSRSLPNQTKLTGPIALEEEGENASE